MKQIKFYEWSNLNGDFFEIDTLDRFLEIMKSWTITVTASNMNFLNDNDTIFAVCKPGKPELVLSKDYKNLRKNFSKCKRKLNKQ